MFVQTNRSPEEGFAPIAWFGSSGGVDTLGTIGVPLDDVDVKTEPVSDSICSRAAMI